MADFVKAQTAIVNKRMLEQQPGQNEIVQSS